MSILESPSKSTTTAAQSQKLRLELKEWERSFAAANGGRKAGREDIKQHVEIAKKYKAYDKLRSSLTQPQSKSQSQIPSSPRPSNKRHHPASQHQQTSIQTPPKRTKHSHPLHPSVLDPYDAPVSSSLTPIHYHTSIAPTAQKDGRVLGLFDLLSDTSGNSKTPSKRSSLKAVSLNALATPSKRPLDKVQNHDKPLESPNRHSKTPTSVSKRNLLATFLTPSTRRVVESRTPGSRSGVSKLRFDETPAFLRRASQRGHTHVDANGGDDDALPWSPVRVRTKPAGRGLSALVRGLRELEEEKLDDDLEMLRELEAEQNGDNGDAATEKPTAPKVLVGDSQMREMPLGPDGGNRAKESEDEEALLAKEQGKGRDGKPLRVWKKKGQKRSTRRVVMKPVVAKWKPEVEWNGGNDVEEENAQAEAEQVVVETQTVEGAIGNNERGGLGDRDWEESLEEGDELGIGAGGVRPEQKETKKARDEKKEEAPKQKKKKKIAATAHANFRALKIRNKQSKGKKGGGRRR